MITIITGDDSFAVDRLLHKKTKEFIDKFGNLAIEKLDAEEQSFEYIFDAITGSSLFSTEKMLVLRTASKQKDLLDRITDNPDIVPDTTELILVDAKFDKRAKYYKELKKMAGFNEFNQSANNDISGWLTEYAHSAGGKISRGDAQYLVQRVGANKVLLSNEIDKLVSYNHDISRQTIDLLCDPLPQSSIFQLIDAVFVGNVNRATTLYEDQRKQRVEPLEILGMIGWQLNLISLIKSAGKRSIDEIASQAKANPFVLRKSQTVANKLTMHQIRRLVRRTLELDVKLKSTAVDADDSMRYFLLKLSRTI